MPQRNSLRSFLIKIALASTSMLLASCGAKKSSALKAATFRLPWLAADGSDYTLQNVELKTLTDPGDLKGLAASIAVKPEFHQDKGLKKHKANFRFYKNGDVYIAGDTLSLQAATVYAHIERLQEIDRQVGVDKNVAQPRKVGVDSQWKLNGKDIIVNNAIYDGRSDAMVIVPYDSDELPIALNAGVIAHEYSHGIFNALVRKPVIAENFLSSQDYPGGHFADEKIESKASDREKEQVSVEEFNWEFALRAADEGLADYWAWVYTGDDVFMSRSLSDQGEKRRLDKPAQKFQSVQIWVKSGSQASSQKKSMTSLAYQQGTEYARFFRELSVRLGKDKSRSQRVEVAKRLVPALKVYAEKVNSSFGSYVSPDLLLESYLEANQDLAAQHCSFFQQTLSQSESLKTKGCQ